MAIPTTGPLNILIIRAEFGGGNPFRLSAYYRGKGRVPVSATGVPETGPFQYSDLRGASNTTSGTMNFDTPGTYKFTVPAYVTMTVRVAGAGGGGASSVWDGGSFVGSGGIGAAGEDSTFLAIKAGAGGGGGAAAGARYPYQVYPGAAGTPGIATGGDVNTPGGGSVGGVGGSLISIGGGSNGDGGVGGNGGLGTRTYKAGETGSPVIGQEITLVVGAGGIAHPGIAGPPNTAANGAPGTNGSPGYVRITWA